MLSCIPNIVYSNKWTGQTSAISSTTIFTPPAEGLYRITVGIVTTGTAGVSTASVAVQPLGVGESNLAGDFPMGGAFVFVGENGTPITFSTTVGGSPTYDLYITIEQLQ